MRARESDMPGIGFHTIAASWRNLWLVPGRAPRSLERLAAICLRAEAEDSRLGDLSEKYVRMHSAASGSCALQIPGGVTPGTYELRLFAANGLTRLATSSLFDVTP